MKSNFYRIADDYLSEVLNVGKNFDVVRKELAYKNKKGILYLLTTLSNAIEATIIAESLITAKKLKPAKDLIYNAAISEENDFSNLAKLCLSGVAILLLPNCDKALTIEIRNYPNRSIAEPSVEKSVRGSKDGFNESINDSIGLIRRRIRSRDLKIDLASVGKRSKTDVALVYLDNKVDKRVLEKIKKQIDSIEIDSLVMTSKALVESLLPQHLKPFPLARYTQRPDVASINILQGKIAIVIDTSPDVIILPISYFDHLENVEEYHQSPLIGSLTRFIRNFGVLLSIFLVPLWYILISETSINNYFILRPSKEVSMPLFLQIIIAELFVELIRLAIVHAPSELTSSIGVVAAIILGSVTIELDFFLPEVLVYISFAAIASFATPSYELSLSNRLIKFSLLILCFIMGRLGFIIGCIVLFMILVTTKNYGMSYLKPLIPFDFKASLNLIYRNDYGRDEGVK